MKQKPIKIAWEELEDAFSSKQKGLVSYLDRVTGHVVLEGEGEEDDRDEQEGHYPTGGAITQPTATVRNDPTRLKVNPPDDDLKIEWLELFIRKEELDAELSEQLTETIDAENPAAEISRVLNQNPPVRDDWYAYRTERVHEMIDTWLSANGVEPVEPAPWKK